MDQPKGKKLINDIARRMHKVMTLVPAQNGTAVLTQQAYEKLDDKDLTVLWYMPVKIVTETFILKDIQRRAKIMGLLDVKKIVANGKIQAN